MEIANSGYGFYKRNKISRKQQSLLCNDLWWRYSKIHKLYSKLCKYKEWQLKGMAEIKMPENYIALFSTTDKETSKQMIKEADKQIYRIISDIRNENEFETITPSGLGGTIKSGIINTVFIRQLLVPKDFIILINALAVENV